MAYTELGDAMKRGYSIRYDSGKTQQGRLRTKIAAWRALVLVLAAFVVYGLFRYGYAQNWQGDFVRTASALEQFAVDCRDGTSVTDALAAFCREILYGA